MQDKYMNSSDPHIPPNEASVVARAFGTTAILPRLPRAWFNSARTKHPEHAVLYCTRCGQMSRVHPDKVTSLLQLVMVPPDMPDEQVPTGHDVLLPRFDPATQYICAANTCPTCMAGADELALIHLTIDTPDDTIPEEDSEDEASGTAAEDSTIVA
ncbi:MAG: hypothetical protein RL150_306 [Candidatus Parcubacteria bacterium]